VITIAKTIQQTLQSIVQCFESGTIPEAISYSVFPAADIPSANWSFINRIIMHLSGTADGRGFRQWKKVNRFVKKGVKAFYILVPRFINHVNEEDEENLILTGFMTRPVFRVEDTAGDPLEYEKIEVPELELIERARDWGLSVKAVPGNFHYYGYFSKDNQEIALASKEETVFFHELSHAAHSRVIKEFDKLQTWRKEIVAELSAAVLCRLVGKTSKYLGNNYQYIKHYAKEANHTPVKACLKVMGDVESVLKLILEFEEKASIISESKRDVIRP
jgi:N-terminal domain of anti-restriction factor ArdC